MGPIVVTQTLRIVVSATSGEPDVIKIQYDLVNIDAEPHDAGLRLLLDTEINGYDGCPRSVSRATRTPSPQRPSSVARTSRPVTRRFFDLADPVHVIEGTLRGGDMTPPDRVAFVSWFDASSSLWDYPVTPNAPFGDPSFPDSGVLSYWNPQTLAPGASRHIVSAYGLGVLAGSSTLALSGPARLGLTDNAWAPNPFTVTAYLKNTDCVDEDGEALTLSFGESGGLALDAGETATHSLPIIPAGETLGAAWRVVPLAPGVWTYRVAKASTPGTWAERQVVVPQPWACVP